MTSHRWKLRRSGGKLIVDADDPSGFTAEDVDALVNALEPQVRDGDVKSVELAGEATAIRDGRQSLTTLVRRLGTMVNRYHKAFTVRL